LNLGRVRVTALVTRDGQNLGMLWKPPFRLALTAVAKPGDKALAVRVVNRWIHRQIGGGRLPKDSLRNPDGTLKEWPPWVKAGQPSPTGRFTFTSWQGRSARPPARSRPRPSARSGPFQSFGG
jgi:hypothetical protein